MNTGEKTILLVVRHPVGGIKAYFKYIYNKPVFKSYQFIVVLPEGSYSRSFIEAVNSDSFRYITTKPDIYNLIRTVISVIRNYRISLVHSHGYTSGVVCSLPAAYYSIPHVLTAHDILLDNQFIGINGRIKKTIICYLLRFTNVIHAVSDDANKNIREMLPCLKSNNVITIRSGIETALFTETERRDFRKELGLPKDVFLFGFLGRFMSPKGFRYIIDAISLIDKHYKYADSIRVIAIGNDGFLAQEQRTIRSRNLEKYFIFLDPVDNPAPSIQGFDAILMPSLWEACGLVAMEALVAGVPIIASNCIGLREVIDGSPAFVVKPADGAELSEAIMQAYENNRKNDFRKYSKTAIKRFDCNETARSLHKLYRSFL